MSGKVIQGSFVGGQPRWSKIAPSGFQARTAVPPPPTAFAGPRTGAPPAFAARQPMNVKSGFAARPLGQTLAQPHGASDSFQVDPGRLGLVSSGGKPLPDGVRTQMEVALGADFSRVRVHVGPQADRIGAIAFTTGNDIYFAPGRFQPDTVQGKQLLGHELAHVVQQRQGRVRNAPGLGVAVVHDRALEAEADRLGRFVGVIAQRAIVQPKTAGFRVGPPQAAWDASRRSISPKTVRAIQRTIWKYDGTEWKKFEVGTAGGYDPRAVVGAERDDFYNDVTGKKGRTIEDVRGGLADLLLVTGSLNTLEKAVPWPPTLWDKLNVAASKKQPGATSEIVTIGKVKLYSAGTGRSLELDPDDGRHVQMDLLQQTWDFLNQFLEANGQLPSIKRQKWFQEDAAEIIVDVNFYYNREPNEAFGFHKDTGGDNLFVNLIFNNQEEILGTEWIEDTEEDAAERANALKYNLPDTEIEHIKATRAALKQGTYKLKSQGKVRGGIATQKATYVSWVDELVWHSTPAPLSRTEYFKNLLTPENYWKYKPYAVVALRDIWKYNAKRWHGIEPFAEKTQNNGVYMPTFTVFCEQRGIKFRIHSMKKRDVEREAVKINDTVCDAYMNTVQMANAAEPGLNFAKHQSDLGYIDDVSKYNVGNLGKGNAIDADEFAGTTEDQDKPTGITPTVRRKNSFSKHRISKIGNEPRSFIRTWVRVHRKDTRGGF